MNKTAIKNFAVWARNKLIADITYRAGLIGVSEKGIAQPLPQSSKDLQFFDIGTKDYAQVAGSDIEQRNALVRAIQEKERTSDYKTAFKAVIEEVAYTWFNRLIAIRFMEVNEYLPSRIRVLSSENPAKNEPDFVTTPFDTDMEFTMAEQDKIMQLKDENKLDELFRMLFIKQCNKLHEILPELFEETNHYTELLLSISFTDNDGIVYHLVHDIPEGDFNVEEEGQVEIIGWMYQYYNIEPKDETFALLKKNVKITKERIPAATQLFTPDWIVRYMVENSLGRLWVEGHPNDTLKENWKYYLEEAEQEASVLEQLEKIRAEYCNLNPEDIKVIDPCMGSGHILVYCFDVLMQIYESQGYTQRDAAQSILENNLFGLDIDKRAAQLSYFAVMMKARQYDRRIFARDVTPHIFAIEESNTVNKGHLKYFGTHLLTAKSSQAKKEITNLIDAFFDAEEFGSILNIGNCDWALLNEYIEDIDDAGQMSFETVDLDKTQRLLRTLITQGNIMSQKYNIVVTNPPYMSITAGSTKLNNYVKDNYPDSKTDLFSVFIEKCRTLLVRNGYQAMITMHAWMFLSSYEKLRSKLRTMDMVSMAHLGARAFEEIDGEVVQTTSFIFRNSTTKNYKGKYCRLVQPSTQKGKEDMFLAKTNEYISNQNDYQKIPGSPIAYWAGKSVYDAYLGKQVGDYGQTRKGMATGLNDEFVRNWYEVQFQDIGFSLTRSEAAQTDFKWFPYANGGNYRKWYGNYCDVVLWENDGYRLQTEKHESGTRLRAVNLNLEYIFREGISWTSISTTGNSMRILPKGFLFSSASNAWFGSNSKVILAFLNCCISGKLLEMTNPTLNANPGDIARLPIKEDCIKNARLIELVDRCVELSKADWDSFETSWDFSSHPLLNGTTIAEAYQKWETICDDRFCALKQAEEEINQIFISYYGMEKDVSSSVDDKFVTVRKAEVQRDVKSLLSYAIGCMFGRYSVDSPGLVYAGGKWDIKGYTGFTPDKDNCIPITDEEYFHDDVVGLLCEWLTKVYGAENLEDNLKFIAKALGNKGKTSREVVRNYFLNDFIKDHIKTYQKRPIYWLFDSGKQDGFKALVYMHRWNADTVGNLRVEYLHRMQRVYESEITRMQEIIENSRDSREISTATKRKEKLQKQLKESKDYDSQVAYAALSRMEIDLDKGVKCNYERVQTGPDGKKLQLLSKM